MTSRLALRSMALFTLIVFLAGGLSAQTTINTLTGKIVDSTHAPVPAAVVSIRNTATGQSAMTQSDAQGNYSFASLAPGDYQLSVSAPGFSPSTSNVTIAAGAPNVQNISLASRLSLGDLGFTASETQGNAQTQARLDKRSHMLQIHQRLGLITTGPLIATVITGALAGGRSTSSTDRDIHAALSSATAGLYFATAYYAIFAPKIPGTKTEGNIRLHKAMAWIHGPGMVLTPILGAIAFDQKSKGERVHGIARAHGEVAIITAGAYGVAILSVSLRSGSLSRSAHHIAALFGLSHSDSTKTIVEDDTSANP